MNTIVNKIYEVQKTLSSSNILLVTSGIRWNHRARAEFPSSVCLQVDCRHFSDPNETKDLRGHIGRQPRILKGLIETPAMRQMIDDALRFIDDHAGKKLVINLFCKSGRHRSVGAAIFSVLSPGQEECRPKANPAPLPFAPNGAR